MRISDWSSDVCSSDLRREARGRGGERAVSINFSAWAIGRPLPALMLFFGLCVAGLWGFHELPVARFPDIAFPMTTITITQPGASPSQLEAAVTRRVADSVRSAEHTSELPSLMRISYAVFCLKKTTTPNTTIHKIIHSQT